MCRVGRGWGGGGGGISEPTGFLCILKFFFLPVNSSYCPGLSLVVCEWDHNALLCGEGLSHCGDFSIVNAQVQA